MTREEFRIFRQGKREIDKFEKLPEDAYEVYFDFAAYYDYAYFYSPSEDTIYELSRYIGD